jgi:hypothetical protein
MPATRSLLSRAPGRRRLLAAAGVTVALSMVVAACGGDDEPEESSDQPSDSTSTAGAVTLDGLWPLTGEKLDGALPKHPVYVVKIDNTSNSAPQIGLSSADMVVEELVEGGLTRLAVFYYQDLPQEVGPVRSMRGSDVGIVAPVSATLVASGGAPKAVRQLAGSDIATLTEGAPGYSRDPGRSVPYNLFMDLAETADEAGKDWSAPEQTYFQFGDASDLDGGSTVTRLEAEFSGGHTTEWSYSGKAWTRAGSFAADGEDFTADNILALRVRVGDAGYLDPAGNPVPETDFSGKGTGVLVHGDQAVQVKWSKRAKQSQLKLTTRDGNPVKVPPGNTWVELVPSDGGSVVLSK